MEHLALVAWPIRYTTPPDGGFRFVGMPRGSRSMKIEVTVASSPSILLKSE
jgi:hypothetical protein